MKNLTLAMAFAAAALGARPAAALTYLDFTLQGSSCVSKTSGTAAGISQFGVNADGTALDVVCSLTLPAHRYTYANMQIFGYNRSSAEKLSCTVSATDYVGGTYTPITVTLPNNSPYPQTAYASATFASLWPATFLSISCHLPAVTESGYSHLTAIYLQTGY